MRDSHGNRLVWMAAARDRDAFARAIAESTRCRNDAEKSLFTHHRINSRPRHFSQHAGGVRSGFIHKNLYMWVTDKPALIASPWGDTCATPHPANITVTTSDCEMRQSATRRYSLINRIWSGV